MKESKLKLLISNIIKFVTQDMWNTEVTNLSKIRKNLLSISKWLYLTVYGFINDQCLLRASALTYVTLLSIVPFLAVAFSISKGFGFQNTEIIRNFLLKITAGREMIVDNIINYINNTNVGTLGAIGIATLLFTVISMLGNIEKAFNTIWGVKKSRTFARKFIDYLSVTIIFPFLIIVAVSSTATLQSNAIIQKILSISVFSYLYIILLKFIPYIMIWLALIFIYTFMPNTKVKFYSAIVGGVIGGIIWQIAQWGYLNFQVGVTKYNAIYGSFAQLPLFLIWLYFSWIIILLGAEMCFATQNFKTFQRSMEGLKISHEMKQKLAIKILLLLAKNFEMEKGPILEEKIAEQLNIPIKIISDILYILETQKVILRINKDEGNYFTLNKPTEKIDINHIIKKINEFKEIEITFGSDKEAQHINHLLGQMEILISKSKYNETLKKITNQLS